MKQKIFMYLFIFTSLLVLFQYVNAKNIFKDIDKKLVTSRTELKKYKDSVAVLQNEIIDASHFNLDKN